MSSKTKIVVLRMKEIIYTAIFVGLAILLVTLCFIMSGQRRTPLQSPHRQLPMSQAYTAQPLPLAARM